MAMFISKINAKVDEVFSWHQEFGASERLTPPWSTREFLRQEDNQEHKLKFLKTSSGVMLEKSLADPAKRTIILEKIKSDQQQLTHTQSFRKVDNSTLLQETISVKIFESIVPNFITQSLYSSKLAKEFHFRTQRIENDIQQHNKFANRQRKNIALLGVESTLAKQFKPFFTTGKHKVFNFVNRKPYPTAREIQLGDKASQASLDKLKEVDSVIFFGLDNHKKLKTLKSTQKAFREKILELQGIMAGFKANNSYPETFVMVSSTCVYSEQKNATEYTITSPHNTMAEYFLKLEKIVKRLEKFGTRVVIARTGTMLSAREGMLKTSINLQKFGMSFLATPEEKFINWTTVDDTIYAINHILYNYDLTDVVNICSSMIMKADDIQILLSQTLNNPFTFKLPDFISKWFSKDIADQEILQNSPAFPQKLRHSNFFAKFNNINDALNWETGTFNKDDEY